MIRGLLFVGGLGIVGVIGYRTYKYYNSQISILSKKTKIALVSVGLVNKNKENVTLRFNLKVTNNSEQKFTIKRYGFEILFNNKLIGNIDNSNLNTVINPNGGNTNLSFDFSINPSQIGLEDILSGLISNKLNSTLSLKGRVVVKKGFVTLNSPLDVNYSLKELF